MGVEVDEADRAVASGDSAYVRLRNRVVAAEDDRNDAGVHHLPDQPLDGPVRSLWIGRQHGRVAEVDDPQLFERVDPSFKMRAGRTARRSDRARREPCPGPVGDEVVGRGAHDRHVDAVELGRVLGIGRAAKAQQPGVVRLVREAERAPPLERVDHRPILSNGPKE